jgi:hypothetical protein
MLKFKNIIVSESCSVDKDTGSLSLFNILRNVGATSYPLMIQRLVITAILERALSDQTNGNVDFQIKQCGTIDFQKSVPYLFNINTQSTQLIIRLNGFIVKQPGDIEFIVKTGDVQNSYSVSAIVLKNQ